MLDETELKHSGTTCRNCTSTIRKIPVPAGEPHANKPLVICSRCDRLELWPGNAQS